MNALVGLTLAIVFSVLARSLVDPLRALPVWLPMTASIVGAVLGGLAGSTLVHENPLRLDVIDPVGLGGSMAGSLLLLLALEARPLPRRW